MLHHHPEFERALFERPDDDGAWAVYGDWLAAQGDLRGELIQLELAVEAGQASPALRSRYAKLMVEEHPRWVGEQLDALLAEPDASRNFVVEWRRGHLLHALIHAAGTQLAAQRLAALLASPTAMMLEQIDVAIDVDRGDLQPLAPAVWQQTELHALRRMTLSAWTFRRGEGPPLFDLAFDWQQTWPRLEVLRLHALHWRLAPQRHARLRQLELSTRHGVEIEPLRVLGQAELPALEHLALFLGVLDPLGHGREHEFRDALAGVLEMAGRANVARLALIALDQPELLLEALADRPELLARLERLYLGWGLFGDELMAPLAELLGRCPRLRDVDLGGNYISSVGAATLRGALIRPLQIDGLENQKTDRDRSERQVPVFGRYGIAEDHYDDWEDAD
ncbi:TIGR02996 domain-containing protein [Nannocystaceae bacterium ST9]